MSVVLSVETKVERSPLVVRLRIIINFFDLNVCFIVDFVYLCTVFLGTQHFICSFATRTATSESERAILTTKRLAPKAQASHKW